MNEHTMTHSATEAAPLLVVEATTAYGIHLSKARRLTDDEKTGYAEWFRRIGMVGLGEHIELPMLNWDDMPKRQQDGQFRGCYNQAWIITPEQWDAYIALNAERQEARRIKEESETRRAMLDIIAAADRQGGAYTTEEAKRRTTAWINAVNEGGEGYVPHYVTINEVERAKAWLANHPD